MLLVCRWRQKKYFLRGFEFFQVCSRDRDGRSYFLGSFIDSSSLIRSLDSSTSLVFRKQWRQKEKIIHSLCVPKPLVCNIDQRWEKLLPSSRVLLTPVNLFNRWLQVCHWFVADSVGGRDNFLRRNNPGGSLCPNHWFQQKLEMGEATSSRVSLTPGRKRSQSHKSLRDISVVSFVVGDLKGKQPDVWYTSHQRICTISGPETALLKLVLIEHACLLILPKVFPCEYSMLKCCNISWFGEYLLFLIGNS